MNSNQRELLKAIGLILWNDWDPINVNQYPQIRDEYDSYITTIYSLLFKDDPVDKIANALYEIETKSMGVTGHIEHCKKIAEKIVALKSRI